MSVTTKWALGLAVLLAALLQAPLAWGQLRTHSGAARSSLEHPKELGAARLSIHQRGPPQKRPARFGA